MATNTSPHSDFQKPVAYQPMPLPSETNAPLIDPSDTYRRNITRAGADGDANQHRDREYDQCGSKRGRHAAAAFQPDPKGPAVADHGGESRQCLDLRMARHCQPCDERRDNAFEQVG